MLHVKGSSLRWGFFAIGFCVGISMLFLFAPSERSESDKQSVLLARLENFLGEHESDTNAELRHPQVDSGEGQHNETRQHKVLCWIMTHKKNLPTKAKAVNNTWGKRCDTLLFVSDEENKEFPTIPINITTGREYLSEKTLTAFQYVYENYIDAADWFLKADDDTFIVMENLKYFLSEQDPEKAVYYGHRYRPWVNQGYFSGGAGYVISREGLRRFGTRNTAAVKPCQPRYGGAEDVMFGRCMEFLNVKTGESRDKHGRSRFHSMDISAHISGDFAKWYYFYDALNGQGGAQSISEYPISFHYVAAKEMHALEFLIYSIKLHSKDPSDVNIPKNSKALWMQ